jgi:hypothetical protein
MLKSYFGNWPESSANFRGNTWLRRNCGTWNTLSARRLCRGFSAPSDAASVGKRAHGSHPDAKAGWWRSAPLDAALAPCSARPLTARRWGTLPHGDEPGANDPVAWTGRSGMTMLWVQFGRAVSAKTRFGEGHHVCNACSTDLAGVPTLRHRQLACRGALFGTDCDERSSNGPPDDRRGTWNICASAAIRQPWCLSVSSRPQPRASWTPRGWRSPTVVPRLLRQFGTHWGFFISRQGA